jgi:steroid 5-alpha reductase family enzyme
VADLQKSRFTGGYGNTGTGICDVGLWRYSRHPNYFGQWVQWVALVGLALPSLAALRDATPAVAWVGLLVFLLMDAGAMYSTLVHYTGAVPAEHYSVRKRPAYAEYQATANRFFPGPRRRLVTSGNADAASL